MSQHLKAHPIPRLLRQLRQGLLDPDVGEKPQNSSERGEVTMDRTVTSFGEDALARRKTMLKTAFGPVIADALVVQSRYLMVRF